jgi:hypothetical protein
VKAISLDPSLRSLGIFTCEDGVWFSEAIQRKEENRIDVLGRFCLKFARISAEGWDLMIIEQYAFMAREKFVDRSGQVRGGSSSLTGLAEVGGLLRGLFNARKVPIIEVPIGTWKMVTGISMKKGRADYESDYLNEVTKKFGARFKTTDEADAFLLYQCVKISGEKNAPGVGAANIRYQLEKFKIDPRKL